ncbi:MAG TPA: M28 family peptidase [Pseudoxanthomonas sp.]|nr:M28 family peptidase [Pseudoxanthomonas sp.]
MRRRAALLSLFLFVFLIATAACRRTGEDPVAAASADAASAEAAARIEADVRYLASDELEGRQTGAPGYDLAAEHVAARYAEFGLEPAGDDGTYFQRVPLLRATRGMEGSRFEIERDGRTTVLKPGKHYLSGLNYRTATHSLRAQAVFVGHGVSAPDLDYDDFAGVDLEGRIAIVLSGAPSRFDNDRRAFYSNGTHKMRTLAEKGAIGVVMLNSREHEARTPWERTASTAAMPGMRLRGEDGGGVDSFPQIQATAVAGAAAASAIFAGSGRTAKQVFDAAEAGTLTPFELPGTLLLAGSTTIEPMESRNVVARLPGSDPSLRGEHVVYSAHLDHLGVGPEENGDGIYNGALDNALGISIMLEAARQLAAAPKAPRRSMVFVAVTAEEKGPAGRAVVRDPSARRRGPHGGQHQHGHARAAGADPRRGPDRRGAFVAAGGAGDGRGRSGRIAFPRPGARGSGVRAQRPVRVRARRRAGGVPEGRGHRGRRVGRRSGRRRKGVPPPLLPPSLRRRIAADPVRRRRAPGTPQRAHRAAGRRCGPEAELEQGRLLRRPVRFAGRAGGRQVRLISGLQQGSPGSPGFLLSFDTTRSSAIRFVARDHQTLDLRGA